MSLVKFFASKQEAEEFGEAMNIAAGLPLTGRPITGGIHVGEELRKTTKISKPELTEDEHGAKRWAYAGCLEQKAGERVTVKGKHVEIDFSGAVRTKEIEDAKSSRRDAASFAAEEGKKVAR